MTKADLVQLASETIGPGITKKDCAVVVDAFLNSIKDAMAEHKNIEIRGFGTFKVRERKSRLARNPRTPEPWVTAHLDGAASNRNSIEANATSSGRQAAQQRHESGVVSRVPRSARPA